MTSQQPTAQPKSVLRGHKAQVHATTFVRNNQRLVSGDAEGFVVLWDLIIMRPRAVWRAHQNAILGIEGWGDDKIITHGRDNRLIVWKLVEQDEVALNTALPLDQSVSDRKQPWIRHILEVNTMNFCSFASCPASPDDPASDELLVAVPNTLSSECVDIWHLPSEMRRFTVQIESVGAKIGMVMTLSIIWLEGCLTLAAGYENGLAMVTRLGRNGSWEVIYRSQPHDQPILSLDVSPDRTYFLTSGADAIIAKHPIPNMGSRLQVAPESENTRECEQPQDKLAATSTSPPAASVQASLSSLSSPSLLSSALAGEPPTPPQPAQQEALPLVETVPLKTVNTKHSGQQSLHIRSDGKIFATAGWDSKVRAYSTKTLSELAVLKWHDVGCYTVAFAEVGSGGESAARKESNNEKEKQSSEGGIMTEVGELSVKDRRIKQAKEAHWLAAGSKDGKISLWDIY